MKKIIVSNSCGRLGNHMYRMANLIAFCLEHRILLWDRSMHSARYTQYFPRIRKRLLLKYPDSLMLPFGLKWLHRKQSKILKTIARNPAYHLPETENREWKHLDLDPESFFRHGKETVILNGFLYQADEYLFKYASEIRRLFRPEQTVVDTAEEILGSFKVGNDTMTVGVHVRRGDFAQHLNGKYYIDTKHYADVMQKMTEFCPAGVKFIIVSDDDALDTSDFEGLDFLHSVEQSSLMLDWYLISQCDYILAPLYSTYSGWASFYGETPIYRLNGFDEPSSLSDFKYRPILNNSKEFNRPFEPA